MLAEITSKTALKDKEKDKHREKKWDTESSKASHKHHFFALIKLSK